MALLTISYDEKPGMSCETLINPATRRLYAITRIAKGDNLDDMYIPLSADMTQAEPGKELQPIPVPGKPSQVYACNSSDEARMVLETHDELYATHPPAPRR